MRQRIDVHLDYALSGPTDLLLQIEVPDLPDQRVSEVGFETSPVSHSAEVAAEDGIGNRRWLRAEERFRCDYTVTVEVDRPALDLAPLEAVPPHLLPPQTVRHLMPSRYCPSDEFHALVGAEFPGLSGGALVAAMRDWIEAGFSYVPGSSNAQTTALDTYVQRQGVCRDYAHVLIAMARAATIPARFASVYAPGVTPPDFHAVAEVYLAGTWHLVDATGMATADEIARIGVGQDAAEVAFLSSYGRIDLQAQSVRVTAL